jgi:hypothetical protein
MNRVIGMPANALANQLLDDICANLTAGDIDATWRAIEELREELKTL